MTLDYAYLKRVQDILQMIFSYFTMKPKTIETIGNTELKQVVKWSRLNRLSLNAGKTELIFFHSMRRTLNYDNLSIKLNEME